MPNASDFGFAIDGQLPSRDPNFTTEEEWRTISNAVFASKEARKALPEIAISNDAVSLLVADHYEIEVIG